MFGGSMGRLFIRILLPVMVAVQVHGATPTDEFSAQQLTSKAAGLLRQGRALYYNRGVAQQRLGQLEQALGAFERARMIAPEAVPLLQAAARAAPRHAEITLGLGQALAASGRVVEALEAFVLASVLDFSAAEPVYHAGELLLLQGDAARAAQQFSRAADLDSGHAVALAPRNQQVYYLLSETSTRTGLHQRREQALATFRRLSETARHLRQGILLERQGKLEQAVQAWRRSAAADATNVKPWILTGDALLRLGEDEAAGTAFTTALALSPASVRDRYGLGLVHFLAGRSEQALSAFTRVLEQDSDHVDANYHAGLSAVRLGRQESARRYLLRTLDVDPGHEQARAALASIPAR
jgi:tetratricopeptide (TPR) repeat protein